MQKDGLQSTEEESSGQVVVDEIIIQIDNQRYYLYTVVNPDTNEFFTSNSVRQKHRSLPFFWGVTWEKQDVSDAAFLVDNA